MRAVRSGIHIEATHTLDESDRNTLRNGLQVAAERFDEHVGEFHGIAKALRRGETVALFAPGERGAAAADRLAEQFKQQAADSRRLMRLIEDADDMSVYAPEHEENPTDG